MSFIIENWEKVLTVLISFLLWRSAEESAKVSRKSLELTATSIQLDHSRSDRDLIMEKGSEAKMLLLVRNELNSKVRNLEKIARDPIYYSFYVKELYSEINTDYLVNHLPDLIGLVDVYKKLISEFLTYNFVKTEVYVERKFEPTIIAVNYSVKVGRDIKNLVSDLEDLIELIQLITTIIDEQRSSYDHLKK